jgi:hypothetical protein
MKKEPMKSTAHNAGEYLASVFTVAALVFLFVMAGCTTSKPATEPVTTPPVTATTIQTTVTTMTVVPTPAEVLPDQTADKKFADAADACYNKTPVITNLTTHLAFATCMKDTPLPSGNCALNYRYYVLKHTNEDATSAGFARETEHARLARDAFLRGEGYDGVRLEYTPCGNATLIRTSFYK